MTDEPHNRLTGFVILAVAVFILLTALIDRSIPGDRRWLMAAVAAVFALAGLQLVTAARGRMSYLMAGTVCALFSALGVYVAVSSEPLGGGLPFIPGPWNQGIGYVLFGFGALVTCGMAAYYASLLSSMLVQKHKFPCLHKISRLKTIEVHSARQVRTVKPD